jgi:hypothetical protein
LKLQRAIRKRSNYRPEFDVLKEAIISRDSRKLGLADIEEVLIKHRAM